MRRSKWKARRHAYGLRTCPRRKAAARAALNAARRALGKPPSEAMHEAGRWVIHGAEAALRWS